MMSDYVGIFIALISLFCGGFALGVKWGEGSKMSDLISRDEAIDVIFSEPPEMNYGFYYAEKIKALPSVQPERKKGKWIQNDNGTYSCSLCQSWIPKEQHYYARFCLYCGADMRTEKYPWEGEIKE